MHIIWWSICTWMHKASSELNSFFKLSRIIPYIFSTYAVSCCLKRRAGYLASTWRTVSSAAAAAARLTLEGEERKPCIRICLYYLSSHSSITNKIIQERIWYFIKRRKGTKNMNTMAILPNREVGLTGVAAAAPAGFKLFWSKNSSVEVFDNQ